MKKLFSPVKAASLFIVVAILAFAGYLAIGRKSGGSIGKNPLVNISELPKEYMEEYFQEYAEIAKTYRKENILIVISKTPLKDTYDAVEVVEAANNQYFLQYETELEKETAFQELNAQGVQVFRNNIYKVSENEEAASGIYNSWGIEAMGLDYASELIDGLEDVPEVTVAVIDTGLDMELMNKYFPGKVDEVYNVLDSEGEMTDEHGHGTHIAGTIAEGTPSNVKILPIKLSSDGFLADTDVITAIDYVTYYEKADVMNMSFGGIESNEFTQPTYLALEAAKEKNIIGVAAAGNESTDADSYPAAFDNTISVSAIDSLGNLADFSNYGDKVTFSAPGVGIKSIMSENATISLDNKNEGKDDNDSDFETIDGTSMATPHVVSAVAILKSLNKNISFDDTIEILSEHVEDFGSSGWDMQYGYGMINFDGVTACRESSVDCDSSNIFEIDVPSGYEISEAVLTPYNYGSPTNILATKVFTTTTNGAIREKMLGDFDVDEIEIVGYDPYSTEEQIVTVYSSDFEISFSVTNPANWETGWEYTDSNDGIRLTKYKPHDYGIKTLYFPSVIDSKTVVEIGGNSTCIFGCDEEPNNDSPVYAAAILPSTIIKIDNGLNKLC